jgi:hypothetical protein
VHDTLPFRKLRSGFVPEGKQRIEGDDSYSYAGMIRIRFEGSAHNWRLRLMPPLRCLALCTLYGGRSTQCQGAQTPHAALAAVEAMDQRALAAAGDALVGTCNGCHEAFKPDMLTEGIEHVPHYEQL